VSPVARSSRALLAGSAGALVLAALWIVVVLVNAPPTSTESVPRPADATVFTVEYVFDGDTIEARQQDGTDLAGTGEPVRIRLIGIDTPEGRPEPECGADAARDRLRELLPEGSTVWAAPDREARDRYDRLLLYLWNGSGTFVNDALVREGHAEALRVEPNTAQAELFSASESAARADGLGQWGAC
jgi:micrococcal nuclease